MAEERLVFENDDASFGLKRKENAVAVDTIIPRRKCIYFSLDYVKFAPNPTI